MKLQTFRIDKETETALKAVLKLKRPKEKKGTYYRNAVKQAVDADKKKLQQLAQEMNTSNRLLKKN